MLLQLNLRGEMSRNTIKTIRIITGNERVCYPYIEDRNKYFKNHSLNYNSYNILYIRSIHNHISEKNLSSFEQIK